MMARIMGLPEESYVAARHLGKAMQYINFIRDIDEDNRLGRIYLPIAGTGLQDLSCRSAEENREAFTRFIREEIET